MELTPRLALAARFCEKSRRIIDVGCDHGYLCLALVGQGAEHAYASDLRPGPLRAARENIARAGLAEKIDAVLCPGLAAFSPEDADTVVICGMGGETIAAILEAAPWTKSGAHRLVLQPMTCGDRLRRWLAEHGYTVEDEALAREGRRLYTVLLARGGGVPEGGENRYLFTQHLTKDPLFSLYREQLEEKYRRAAAGRRRAGLDAGEEEAILRRLEELHGT